MLTSRLNKRKCVTHVSFVMGRNNSSIRELFEEMRFIQSRSCLQMAFVSKLSFRLLLFSTAWNRGAAKLTTLLLSQLQNCCSF